MQSLKGRGVDVAVGEVHPTLHLPLVEGATVEPLKEVFIPTMNKDEEPVLVCSNNPMMI